MKRDETSVGIQMADVALWLYGQLLKGKSIPKNSAKLLELTLRQGWQNDFSFIGVERHLIETYGETLFGDVSTEKLAAAQRMLEMAEGRRRASMKQFEADGLPPFSRPISVSENSEIKSDSS